MTRLRSRELPKLYYPTPDELQGAMPLNENLWMRQHQGLMLALANTSEGKDLLCIEDHGLPIIGIRKNAVLYDQGGGQLMADFRVGAKWANVVRYRWQEVKHALDRMNELSLLKAIWAGVPAGAATLTVHPDPNPESTSVDGWASQDTGVAYWDTVHDGSGSVAEDDAVSLYLGISAYGVSAYWWLIRRGFFLFDTSALTSGAAITAAVFSTQVSAKVQTVSGQSMSLVLSNPASNTAIAAGDYAIARAGTAKQATDVTLDSIVADNHTPNDWTLDATGRGNVSLTGITKLGMRISADQTDTDPWNGAGVTHLVAVAAETSGTTDDPTLVVTYTVSTFTPRAIMF